jgi:transaldolase
MREGYFHRVTQQTPTRFWINNPSREDTAKAIAAGAISCTTNPAHCMKQISRQEEHDYALSVVSKVINEVADDNEAADLVQQKLVKPIMDQFLPLYEQNPGKQGLVSIQGDPSRDDDPHHIVNEALRYRELGKNFIAKIPVTKAGLKAIEALIAENVPIIATEVMGIAQASAVCELYQRVAKQCGNHPPFYVTHITGIFDDHLKNVVKRNGFKISPDVLRQAGCVVARRQYQIFKERGYPGTLLGGGARDLHHFTEMVGADMHITINWVGTADKLIASDPPVVHRIDTLTPQYVIDELLEKLPDFGRAYFEDRLAVEEFAGFGPVDLFRSSFIKGWDYLLKTIKDSREKLLSKVLNE